MEEVMLMANKNLEEFGSKHASVLVSISDKRSNAVTLYIIDCIKNKIKTLLTQSMNILICHEYGF